MSRNNGIDTADQRNLHGAQGAETMQKSPRRDPRARSGGRADHPPDFGALVRPELIARGRWPIRKTPPDLAAEVGAPNLAGSPAHAS